MGEEMIDKEMIDVEARKSQLIKLANSFSDVSDNAATLREILVSRAYLFDKEDKIFEISVGVSNSMHASGKDLLAILDQQVSDVGAKFGECSIELGKALDELKLMKTGDIN